MTQELKKKTHESNREDESMSWFGALAGGGLAATLMTLLASFLWWSLGVMTGSATASSTPTFIGAVFISCWVAVSFSLWKTR